MMLAVNDREYAVIKLLGKGKGGYSYLVTDGERNFVLKQIHHEPCEYYRFGDKLASELKDYERLREVGLPMPVLFDVDYAWERILKEYIDGPTIFELVLKDCMIDAYFTQIHDMCGLLYANGLNIDYFPTNFVVRDGMLYYIDYECNGYMEQWDFEHWGRIYWRKSEEFLAYASQQSLTAEY